MTLLKWPGSIHVVGRYPVHRSGIWGCGWPLVHSCPSINYKAEKVCGLETTTSTMGLFYGAMTDALSSETAVIWIDCISKASEAEKIGWFAIHPVAFFLLVVSLVRNKANPVPTPILLGPITEDIGDFRRIIGSSRSINIALINAVYRMTLEWWSVEALRCKHIPIRRRLMAG